MKLTFKLDFKLLKLNLTIFGWYLFDIKLILKQYYINIWYLYYYIFKKFIILTISKWCRFVILSISIWCRFVILSISIWCWLDIISDIVTITYWYWINIEMISYLLPIFQKNHCCYNNIEMVSIWYLFKQISLRYHFNISN